MTSHRIPFLQAKAVLSARLKATAGEIAIWVWLGDLDAWYDNSARVTLPLFDDYKKEIADHDELIKLAYFDDRQLEDFANSFDEDPSDASQLRYLTYRELLTRWTKHEGDEASAAKRVSAEINYYRNGGGSLNPYNPNPRGAVEDSMFMLMEIKKVERGRFPRAEIEVDVARGQAHGKADSESGQDPLREWRSDLGSRKYRREKARAIELWTGWLSRKHGYSDWREPCTAIVNILGKEGLRDVQRKTVRSWLEPITPSDIAEQLSKPGRRAR